MNIFFGKISKKVDVQQIEEGYYLSTKGSSWFGEIQIGDYAYIIGGDKIQLWKAREWGEKDGEECLWFDILNKNLNINLNKFTALDFFKLTPALIVLTSRSARNRAFFEIETIKDLPVDYISDSSTYEKSDIYRKIVIHKNKDQIQKSSINIQLYYEEDRLKLYEADFLEDSVIQNFRDNLKFGGKGAVMKDNVIKLLKSKSLTPSAEFTNHEISMRSLYDTLFCEYTEKEKYYLVGAYWTDSKPIDQTDRFVTESVWKNGYEDKFISDVKKIPVGSQVAIKSAFTRERTRSVMAIKARGVVIKNYEDGRSLDVEWEEDFNSFEVDFGGYMTTIKEVKKRNHINAIWFDTPDNPIQNEIIDKMKFPLNQILYGPPGTGKTYNTVFKAAQIVEPEKAVADYDEALRIFNKNLGGQIQFITFHQSYSYEDFIQGLRPDIEAKGQLSFDRKDGVFKKIADLALQNLKEAEKAPEEISKLAAFAEALEILKDKVTDNSERVQINETAYFIATEDNAFRYTADNWTLNDKGFNGFRMKYSDLLRFYEENVQNRQDIKSLSNVSGLAKQHASYYFKAFEIVKNLMPENASTVELTKRKNYVLIIDEINRANISRVFGELITLIEPDKRSHGKIPLSCTLPSGEQFIVPSNLYLLGTMNTADKSIALLDIALRRRFEFVPMYPDYELEYEEKETLRLINERIIKLKGYDFQIGHAYFMEDDFKLVDCINNKIIPLLLEYFLNDEEEVKGILAHAGLILDDNHWPLKIIGK